MLLVSRVVNNGSCVLQVGDNIFIVEERVRRLADRLKKWVQLSRTPPRVPSGCFTVYRPLLPLVWPCAQQHTHLVIGRLWLA